MEKFCVFCGLKPESKTNEHILPGWLIKLTGDPNRQVKIGHVKSKNFPERKFSFSSFKFPSCNDCNELFGELEKQAKYVVEKLLSNDSLNLGDFYILLEWFDKIRIGLWLAHYYLDKNYYDISPNYHIQQRIGAFDRMLGIYFSEESEERLNFVATELPSFNFAPSCFGLIINHIYFINISSPFLFARRIGFPYPSKTFFLPDHRGFGMSFESGRERLMLPLIRKPFQLKGTYLFQPMFRYQVTNKDLVEYYDIDYVRQLSFDWQKGIGKVILQSTKNFRNVSTERSTDWLPGIRYPCKYLEPRFLLQILQSQIDINNLSPSTDKLSKEQGAYIKNQLALCNRANQAVINQITQGLVAEI